MLGSIVQLGGAMYSGAGNVKANYQNKGTDKRLGWQQENLRQLGKPIKNALLAGWLPGGDIRSAREAELLGQVEDDLGEARENARSSAWRYGEAGSPMALRRWQDAKMSGELSKAEIPQIVDLEAFDTLGRMSALLKGYKRAFSPETVYENPNAWAGAAASGFAQTYGNQPVARRPAAWNTYIPQTSPQDAQQNPESMDYFSYFPY